VIIKISPYYWRLFNILINFSERIKHFQEKFDFFGFHILKRKKEQKVTVLAHFKSLKHPPGAG